MTGDSAPPRDPGAPTVDPEAIVIEQHLSKRAARYWGAPPGAEPVVLTPLRFDRRRSGSLHWYRIAIGGEERTVVVKRFDPSRLDRGRRRLSGLADAGDLFEREFRALRTIETHFAALDDPRIGHPEVLDRIEETGAFVIGRVEGTPLNQLFAAQARPRPRPRPDELLEATRRAGSWLRAFHAVDVDTAVTHRATRDELLDLVDEYVADLRERGRSRALLASVSTLLRPAAEAILPHDLPLAVAHSDFAMRNVLVEASGRVVVIDTLARRRAPIYEDLATFLVGTRAVKPQLFSLGLAFPASLFVAMERALLEGYGDDPLLAQQLGVYETLILLDRWAAIVASRTGRKPWSALSRALAERHFERELRRSVARLA
jgi:hypothetical protein